jgi:hypothetical protein
MRRRAKSGAAAAFQSAAAWWKTEDAPARVLAVALDDGDGFRRAERGVEHGGIAEVQIDFAEDEFAEGHVVALR